MKRTNPSMGQSGGSMTGHTATRIPTPAQEHETRSGTTSMPQDYSRPTIQESGATPSKSGGCAMPQQWPPMSDYT